jgi:hypothetical protein
MPLKYAEDLEVKPPPPQTELDNALYLQIRKNINL